MSMVPPFRQRGNRGHFQNNPTLDPGQVKLFLNTETRVSVSVNLNPGLEIEEKIMKLSRIGIAFLFAFAIGCDGTAGEDGTNGTNGTNGANCYDGLTDQNNDGVVDVKDCVGAAGTNGTNGTNGVDGKDGKDGGEGGNAPMVLTEAEVTAIKARVGVAECVACHDSFNPLMVWDYAHSGHGANGGATCVDCHADVVGVDSAEGHRKLPTPETCQTCHANEYAGHRANRHSIASIRNYECGRFDDFPRYFENGSGYHFNDQDVAQLKELMGSGGHGPGADYNQTGIAKCMQCHNVENRCDSCHTRHRFSPKEARHPAACGTCHMGPDHPQIEMYETSKHGVMFQSEGDTKRVPVCVDCHMPYNGKIFPKKTDGAGKEYVDHDLSATIAYGPVGGGTTRTHFTSQNGRVKMVSKEAAGVAKYDELWYAWADGKVYTTATGSTVAFTDIWLMSIADENADGKHDYKVAQAKDDTATLTAARTLMLKVCEKCHAKNFADERLLVADLIHENVKMVQMEAWDIITALVAADIGPYSSVGDRPTNPDNGNNKLAANMKIRNLTALERTYFHIMKYDNVKAWKGAYHFNPDYTHWYGWTPINMKLGQVGDEATQQVMQHLWVKGLAYPGVNKDIFADGLYQGMFYENGIDALAPTNTVQMKNSYDKFPGPLDTYLDTYNAAGGDQDANDDGYPDGDGIADNAQGIDVDMDGVEDFVKTDANGAPLGAGVYRAIKNDQIITFH